MKKTSKALGVPLPSSRRRKSVSQNSKEWTPKAYVTAECRVTDLSPADIMAIVKSRSFTVTTVTACEHAVGRTREMPSTFTIATLPDDPRPPLPGVPMSPAEIAMLPAVCPHGGSDPLDCDECLANIPVQDVTNA